MQFRVIVQTLTPDGISGGVIEGYCTGEANGIHQGIQRAGALAERLAERDEVVQEITIDCPYYREQR